MTTRSALYELVDRRGLDKSTARGLWRLAGFEAQPPRLLGWLRLGLVILAAGLAGLGLVFWIAANWRSLSTFMQFALLQALVLVLYGGAAALPRARVPFSLLALVATGALFAFFGQAYQTGADSWQLFALWAALCLPLALSARADSVWSAWTVVALAGIVLWDYAHAGYSWRFEQDAASVHLLAACGALLVTAFVSQPLRKYSGAGPWAFGFALCLATFFITGTAVSSLVRSLGFFYFMSLALFGAVALAVATARTFDVFAASVTGLALNALLIAGLVSTLSFRSDTMFVSLGVTGLAAATLLGITVRTIMLLAQRDSMKGPAS